MGANAQTSVPAFVTGQVLTAQQQTEINTGVPVFATTTTRDAAFGGSGEKVLAQGQLAYIEASDIVQYYNGTAWATLAPATPAALVYITGASFSSQTSVAFANSTFTSTYTRYLVLMSAESTSGNSTVTMQVRDNAGAKSSALYSGAVIGMAQDGAASSVNTNGGTSLSIGRTGELVNSLWEFIVDNPTSTTIYTTWSGTCFLRSASGANFQSANTVGGHYGVDEAHTGLTFAFSVAATGSYRVYGLADS